MCSSDLDKLHDMFFRTSEKAVGIILDRALGKPNSRFNLNKLTDLEAKIITSFNDYMFNSMVKFLSPAPPELKRSNFDVVHLTFLVKDITTNEVAKFIITLPDELLKPDVVTSQKDKFDYGDFSTSIIDVAIKVGSTRFKLIDNKKNTQNLWSSCNCLFLNLSNRLQNTNNKPDTCCNKYARHRYCEHYQKAFC